VVWFSKRTYPIVVLGNTVTFKVIRHMTRNFVALGIMSLVISCHNKTQRYDYVLSKGCTFDSKVKINGTVKQAGLEGWAVFGVSQINGKKFLQAPLLELDPQSTIALMHICRKATVEKIRDFGSFSDCSKNLDMEVSTLRKIPGKLCYLENKIIVYRLIEKR
jgi:hypothetical protein